MAYLALGRENRSGLVRGIFFWIAGLLAGYAPMLSMMAFVPGFARAFWADIQYWIELYKISTALLPVPWPWTVPFGRLSPGSTVRAVLTSFFFLSYAVFGVAGIVWAICRKSENRPLAPEWIAAAFLGLPYAHYAYSMPETSHLALGSFPFLIGAFILLGNMRPLFKWPLFAFFFASSLIVLIACHPGYQEKQFVEADIAGTKLKVFPSAARYFNMLDRLIREYAPEGRSFLVVPAFTTSYAVWNRKCPIYEIYGQFPRSEAFQKAEIERIKKAGPGFVIVDDAPMGRDDLRYTLTHPLVYRYIGEHFEPLEGYSDNPAYHIYKARP